MAYTTINKSTLHMNTKTYSGTNSTNAQTGVGFKPDLSWIKDRGQNGHNHNLTDSVRGAPKILMSDSTTGEITDSTDALTSFDTDGFTLGANTTGTQSQELNKNGNTYAAWNWLAGGAAPTKTYKVVVVCDSGNKYRFRNSADDTTFGESAVTLDLQEGGTYTFDVSDSTLNSHPFVIGTAANSSEYSTGVTYKLDGVTKTYSQYTSGFSAATTRQLIITLAASAPALYYWCSQHSGMGGAINTNATHGSTNFDGNVTSIVSANDTAGFSIVKWSGTTNDKTIGHGLSTVPQMIIYKNLAGGTNWVVYHYKMSSGQFMKLNLTDGQSNSNAYHTSSPDTAKLSLAGNTAANSSGNGMVAYCFSARAGFSHFGLYKGNGSANGSFCYTGFKPAFVMCREISSNGYQWVIVDETRNPGNGTMNWLFPDSSGVETTESTWDLLSNGFKQRANHSYVNHSGDHIFMAFGQSLVGSNNIPATAR